MIITIDKSTCTFLLHLNPHKTSAVVEGDASLQRTYSALTLEELQRLYQNTTGYTIECPDYNATLQACKTLALRFLTATTE
jgi:hypothetical protein